MNYFSESLNFFVPVMAIYLFIYLFIYFKFLTFLEKYLRHLVFPKRLWFLSVRFSLNFTMVENL